MSIPHVSVVVTLKSGKTESGELSRSKYRLLEDAFRWRRQQVFTLTTMHGSTVVDTSEIAAIRSS